MRRLTITLVLLCCIGYAPHGNANFDELWCAGCNYRQAFSLAMYGPHKREAWYKIAERIDSTVRLPPKSEWQLAQLTTTGAGGSAVIASGGARCSGYTGIGDVIASAVWHGGLRSYNATACNSSLALLNLCLPSSSTCLDMLPGTNGLLLLTAISGTSCNNSTVICTVQWIYDDSGANGCAAAACPLTQATQANALVFVINCINTSLPCVQNVPGASTSNAVGPVTGPQILAIPATWIGVATTSGTVYSNAFLVTYCTGTTPAAGGGLYFNDGQNLSFYNQNTVLTQSVTAGQFNTLAVSGTSLHVYNMATIHSGSNVQNSADPSSTSACGGTMKLGAGGATPLTSWVEGALYASALSNANLTSIYNNQTAVWNF
jgi:hypothetical protein